MIGQGALFNNMVEANPTIQTIILIMAILVIGVGIAFFVGLKDIMGIILIVAMLIIFLYAWGVMPLTWGAAGFLILIVAGYFIFKKKEEL